MKCGQVGLFLNSIEMMESGRCGRRKQRNPKRKNVENGDDTEELEETSLDDNKNKIITSDPDVDNTDTEPDCREPVKPDKELIPDVKPVPIIPQSTEEKVSAILRGIQSAAPDSTSDGDKVRGPQKRKQTEDAKIAELLNRRDTAVIYPEPVEDGEEQQTDGPVSDEEEVVLKCMHCSQTFLRAVVLRDHMRQMHADKPLKFMCPKCDETFHQKSQLDKHLTLHSPTSQNCSVCNKMFANVYRLQRHMISHNESTDLRKFKCPECGKAFKFKHHLKEHVRIHSGEKPFSCNNCGKRFSHSGSFSSHTTSKKCWGLSAHKNRLGSDGSQNHGQTNGQSTSQGLSMFGQKLPLAFAGNKFERSPLQSVPITLAHQQHFLPALYSQQKGTTSFFYPPQMFATPDGFLQPVFSVSQSIPTSLQQQSLNLSTSTRALQQNHDMPKTIASDTSSHMVSTTSTSTTTLSGRSPRSLSPHSQSTRSFSPQSHSGRSLSPMSASCISSPPSHPRRSVTPFSERAISHSPHSHSEQISPDVNSNTKLLIIDEDQPSSNPPDDQNKPDPIISDSAVKIEQVETDSTEPKPETSDLSEETAQKKSPICCHYCGEEFDSPVVQHQHERYMCKQNKDVVQQRSQSEPCQSPHSTVSDISHSESSTHNGSIGHATDDEEVDEIYKDSDTSFDEKKMRIRSLFTEEQQTFLKSQYIMNPRPKKHVLIQIGNKIGFPKRVIQVWFQNMRARERKQGREHVLGLSSVKIESGKDIEVSKPSTYIPNVPKPFPNLMNMNKQPQVQSSGQRILIAGELPLDLSVRKSPPLAHGGASRLSTPDRSSDDQALNLSVKKDSSVERDSSTERQSTKDDVTVSQVHQQKSLQDSAIFKYMQQEGLIQNKTLPHHITSTVSPSLAHTLQNQIFHQSMASVLKMPAYSTSSEQKSNSSLLFDSPTSTSNPRFEPDSKLVIDEGQSDPSPSPKDMTHPNSQVLLHVPLTDAGLHEAATHNLTTLAEAAQHAANILSGKPKRLRKKTWRQMEAEEVQQLDLEDSMSNDEDHPSRKKRKSWKSHRVEREEGMYGCDQCNKVFSKQSSLARHKYEHSGARPFACDLCTKSFKHKHHLTEHKRLHSGEKPFQCKKCGKRFSHSGSFSQHMNHRYNYCSPNKMSDGDCELSSQESP